MRTSTLLLIRSISLIFLFISLGYCSLSTVFAEMSSNSFIIQFGNFNMTGGKKSSSSFTLTDTVGQTAPGQYNGTGVIVKAGFQYVYTIGTFKFQIANTEIDFGELTFNQFATGSTILTIWTKGASGYSVTAFEEHPLNLVDKPDTVIPDTTCDTGTCSESNAQVWINPANVGFGYRMTGYDVPTAFSVANTYKQFANRQGNEQAQVVMSNVNVVKNRSSTVNYKIAVGPLQDAGKYSTSIVYVATPGY